MFVRTESAPEHRDWWLIGSVVGLLAIGLQMVYSSSVVVAHNEFGDDTYFVVRHAAWLIIGFILTYITSRIDYHIWQRVSVLLMGLCLVSLVIVLVPTFGSTAYGAQRWLKLGPIQLGQPSELAKIVLVLYMADWLSRKGEQVRHFTYGSLPFAIIVGLVAGLVMLQPDLGTTLVVIVTAVTIFFIAGANLIHLALMTIPAAAIIGVLVVNVGWRADRVAAFLNPEDDPLGKGWHTMQTLIALGSGGIQGLGLGESRQKHYYVPNAHTDTIFAIIGEELGIIGTILVVLLFGILAWRGLLIASRSSDMFGRLLAVGMVGKIVWQAALNIAVITNTVPYTGVPLPLISYGASSLVVTMISIGVLYSVLRFRAQIPERASAMPVSDDSNEAAGLLSA
ncbi:MAG TPA: putative lipid II flippase FtsW, partial [Chloroflexota bacterium]|nr:putative lipid II flippase FtsW [Chloroflexota bacterium]